MKTSRAKAPTGGQDKGKGLEAGPSGPRTQVPPTLAASPGSRPITASDIKALVENINQKIDGMATRLSTIEQCVSAAPQHPPQLPVRERPVRDNPCSGTSAVSLTSFVCEILVLRSGTCFVQCQ